MVRILGMVEVKGAAAAVACCYAPEMAEVAICDAELARITPPATCEWDEQDEQDEGPAGMYDGERGGVSTLVQALADAGKDCIMQWLRRSRRTNAEWVPRSRTSRTKVAPVGPSSPSIDRPRECRCTRTLLQGGDKVGRATHVSDIHAPSHGIGVSRLSVLGSPGGKGTATVPLPKWGACSCSSFVGEGMCALMLRTLLPLLSPCARPCLLVFPAPSCPCNPKLSTRCYVDRLQTALQSVLHQAPYGINTVPPPHDHTGVWVDSDHKIASIGIQVRHRITSHGFALNIEAQVLDWFRHIVACGIVGKGMTAIERELALRVRDEELARPDLEASYAEHARRDAAAANATAAAAVDANTSSTATEIKTEAETVSKRNAPHFDHLEPEMLLVGPESRVSVETVAPRLVEALGTTFARQMVPAPEDQLRYEADSRGLLNKVWVDGKELKL